jgi:cation diffusion facilitator family transporter
LIAQLDDRHTRKLTLAKRVTTIGIIVSSLLALTKIVVGHFAHSAALFADGIENAGDLFGSGIVLFALHVASQPADAERPYGHGRSETIAGLVLGLILGASGLFICFRSVRTLHDLAHRPEFFAIWPLIASTLIKSFVAAAKFTYGRRLESAALIADARHEGVDILSGVVAFIALSLSLYDPDHFGPADHWGGFAVGFIILYTAWYIVRETGSELMDVMPEQERIEEIRRVAMEVGGVLGVEKVRARNIGLTWHVELHLELSPVMTVKDAREIASQARFAVREHLDWVADVIVHIEPFSGNAR